MDDSRFQRLLGAVHEMVGYQKGAGKHSELVDAAVDIARLGYGPKAGREDYACMVPADKIKRLRVAIEDIGVDPTEHQSEDNP